MLPARALRIKVFHILRDGQGCRAMQSLAFSVLPVAPKTHQSTSGDFDRGFERKKHKITSGDKKAGRGQRDSSLWEKSNRSRWGVEYLERNFVRGKTMT